MPRERVNVSASLDNGRQRVEAAVRELGPKVSLKKEFELYAVLLSSFSIFVRSHLVLLQCLLGESRILNPLHCSESTTSCSRRRGTLSSPFPFEDFPRIPNLLLPEEKGYSNSCRRCSSTYSRSVLRLRFFRWQARYGLNQLHRPSDEMQAQESKNRCTFLEERSQLSSILRRCPDSRLAFRPLCSWSTEEHPRKIDG